MRFASGNRPESEVSVSTTITRVVPVRGLVVNAFEVFYVRRAITACG